MLFAKANSPTPVLNTPEFSHVFSHPLPLCDQGLLRPIELVALPDTPFHIEAQITTTIYRVTLPQYRAEKLFVDERFLSFSTEPFSWIEKPLPSKEELLNALYSQVGLPYIWGGNWSHGIPKLLEYYPTQNKLSETEHSIYTLAGVDCSGILYEVSNGFTPRNTSELLTFGKGISIQGKSAEEIAGLLRPLDLIVWKGHVVIAGSKRETIESHRLRGVYVASAIKRLEEIMHTRKPNDQPISNETTFVLRRWFKSQNPSRSNKMSGTK